jgi:hypothetical protein
MTFAEENEPWVTHWPLGVTFHAANLLPMMNGTQKATLAGVIVAMIAAIPISLQHQRIRELEENALVTKAGLSGADRPGAQVSEADEAIVQPSALSSARSRRRLYSSSDEELGVIPEALENREAELAQISRPFTTDASSSYVKAELAADETLVMGGFQTADGNYLFTFITPQVIHSEEVGGAIQMQSDVFAVPEETVKAMGLETLATSARNTLQHAEAWASSDASDVWRELSETIGVEMLTTPVIEVNAENEFELSYGGYSLGGTIDLRDGGGGFDVLARTELRAQSQTTDLDTPHDAH